MGNTMLQAMNDKLFLALHQSGFTGKSFARMVGLSRATISRLIHSRHHPHRATAAKIAYLLGTNANSLFPRKRGTK